MSNWLQKALFALLALPLASAMAAPMGYSVNSDQPLGDTLHLINLADGSAKAIGTTVSLFGVTRTDIEGLAIAPDGSLWGMDDDRLKLFRIDTTDGTVVPGTEVSISGLDTSEPNDFGMSFTCDGSLYATSVSSRSLYRITLSGAATRIGALGSMGFNISAIASHGANPEKLYGMGNGLLSDGGPKDNRSLYDISLTDGSATLIGDIGSGVAPYSQAGLSFDAEGGLWAITDRSQSGGVSEILSINPETGVAKVQASTSIIGFESLAVAPPTGCGDEPPPAEPETIEIPSLDAVGKLLTILALLLTGLVGLRQRSF